MKKTLITVGSLLLVILVAYGAGIGYYAEKFQANTEFATVDVSNLTLPEAQAKVEEVLLNKEITLTENGQEVGSIGLAELNPTFNTEEALTVTYNSQDPNQWLGNFFQSDEFNADLMSNVEIDQENLNQKLSELGLSNDQRQAPENAQINYSQAEGYTVSEAKDGNQLDIEALRRLILDGIQAGEEKIEINQAFLKPEVTSDDEVIGQYMEQIEQAKDTQITLQIQGEEVVIPAEKIESWIYFDANNQMVFDEAMIQEYVGELNEQYSTFLRPRTFQSTLQGEVTVEPGTLGWSIDREAEAAQIAEDLYSGQDVKRETAVVGTGYNSEGSDIGNTYVEIDIANQTMFIYKDGEQVFQTPVVTGQVGTDTIPGAYAIWDKQENADLRGYNPRTERDYVQPVDYWMPFDDTGQGIHDANWQSSFGGTTYQISGSLGCINTPPEAMATVFELVEVGTPVVVF